MPTPFETSQTTVIYSGRYVQVRSYGCDEACRPVPTPRMCAWHSLIFMREGRFIRWVRGERTLIDRNHVGFFNRGEEYTVWHPDRRGDGVTEIEILPSVLAEIAEANDTRVEDALARPFSSPQLLIDSGAYQVHWEIWREAQRASSEGLAIEETALRLVAHAVEQAAAHVARARTGRRAGTERAHADLAHAAKLYLSTRFRGPVGLDEVATAVHASPYHLCRVFKTQTGTTIHDYLRRQRLRAALERLAEPGADLARLALDLGFSSHSHFTGAFHREFGRTPSQARGRLGPGGLRQMSKILEARRVA
jgi:AraC-like DNA-binding protein